MQRTILITGSNGNLGQDVISTLSAAGHRIIATIGSGDIPESLKQQTISQHRVDLLNETAADTFVRESIELHPQIDAAVLLVGGFAMGGIDVTNEAMLDKQISLNFKTVWFIIKPLIAHFKTLGGGQIIMIGARPAIQPEEGKNVVAYALSKSLLFSLAEIINNDGKDFGITASIIVPGVLDTPPNRKAMPDANFKDWVNTSVVADSISFILSESGKNLRQPLFKLYNRS
ncbi:MAG: SDR family NAD(P)-dependent oxidoreductase [Saprospiraceae bacterium]